MKEWHPHPSGPIAMYIAAALQHPNPRCNGIRERVSTIFVDQHKNKFNYVRVYCSLADKGMVQKSWNEEGFVGEPDSEYLTKCLFNDAKHYRLTYRTMMWLLPQHKEIITRDADYGYLLFDTLEELDAWLDAKPFEKIDVTNGERLLEKHTVWYEAKVLNVKKFLHEAYNGAI